MRKAFDIFRNLLCLAASACILASSAQAADILHPDTTSKLQAFALATNNMAANPSGTNKMILLIISDTNSCTACRSLEFGILPSKAVSDFIAESFVYWACSPEVSCNQYTDYTGNGSVALPTCFIINPFSPPRTSLYSSTGADQANTYYQWLSTSLLKATAPRITSVDFPTPTTAVVSGRSFSTNVPIRSIRYRLNDGAWTSQQVPAGTFGSAFTLPALTVPQGAQNKLYVYGLDSSGTYKTKTNIVNLVPTATKVTPTVVLAANAGSTTIYGQQVQFTATVTGASGQATGNVQFKINDVDSGAPVSLGGGSAVFTAPNLAKGTTTIKAVYGGDSAYNGAEATVVQTVNAASLNVTATGLSRQYNGNNSATVNLNAPIVSGDNVTVNYANAVFDNKNVGNNKTITVTGLSLAGSSAGNYQLDVTTVNATANITPIPLTVTAVTDSKTFDGTTASTKLPAVSGTIVPGDTAAFQQAFTDPNPGTNKTIIASGVVLDGNNGLNYSVGFNPVQTGIIEASSTSTLTAGVVPANTIVKPGDDVVLTAVVTNGIGGETYQWRKDGVAINGANGATLNLSNIAQTNAGSYQVVINGNANSTPANVWVSGDAKLYMALQVFGPAGQPIWFQNTDNLAPGGSVWQAVTNSGVVGLGPQVIVSEEYSTSGSSNKFYRLFIPGN